MCARRFGACSGKALAGHRGGVCHGRLLRRPIRFMEHRGPPGFPGHPLLHAPKFNVPPESRRPALLQRSGWCLRGLQTLGPPELSYFGTILPLARIFARLRIDHPVAGMTLVTVARLATGWRGYALAGRDSHPLDDSFTFQKGLTSFHPREPAFLPGRTANHKMAVNRRNSRRRTVTDIALPCRHPGV